MTTQQRTHGLLALAAVVGLAVTNGFGAGLMPVAVATIQEQFPEHPLTTIMQIVTLPNLVIVPVTLLIGAVVGRRIGFRVVAAVGFVLILLGGLLPVVVPDSWPIVMIGTVLRGIGYGLQVSLPATLAMTLWTGAKAQTYLGWSTAAISLGGVLAQFLGGFLVEGGIDPWLGHLGIVLMTVLVMVGLPEPNRVDQSNSTGQSGVIEPTAATTAPTANRLPAAAWLMVALLLLGSMMVVVPLVSLSSLVEAEGISSAGGAATAMAMFTTFAFLSGMVFGPITKVLGRFWPAIGAAMAVVGYGLVAIGTSLPMLMIGMGVAGFGYLGFNVGMCSAIAAVVPPRLLGFAMSMIMACSNVGIFLSPFFISTVQRLVGDAGDLRAPMYGMTLFFLLLAVLLVAWDPKRGAPREVEQVPA